MTLRSRMLILVAGLACLPGFVWAQPDALKHDPFARPALLKAPPPAAPARDNVGRSALPEPEWRPTLTAVMVAGPKSVVNIDGTLVHIGEEINGHRLVEVREETAVFVKNRKRVTFSLYGAEPTPEAAPARMNERAARGRSDATSRQDAQATSDDRAASGRRDERKLEGK